MIFWVHPATPPQDLLREASVAVQEGSRRKVEALFAYPDGARYLFQMAANRGGLSHLKVAMIPTPPGWKNAGSYWMVFHTVQMIEEDHDPVYEVDGTPAGLKVGREIPEDDLDDCRIKSQSYTAMIRPADSSVTVSTQVSFHGRPSRALQLRLNDDYVLDMPNVVVAGGSDIPSPKPGDLVRAGSLLIPWTVHPSQNMQFSYHAVLPKGQDDQITDNSAYVTAWWLPSLGRLPFTVKAMIAAPRDWVVRAEGNPVKVSVLGQQPSVSVFDCNLPISFPKIVAGKYNLEAQQVVDGESFKIFQLDPVNPKLAQTDLQHMVAAAQFYQSVLGPLPFKGYECYDADRYYGIESYSHTLLQRNVTHFLSHEMGHSYFGGLAPCPYVHDTWNEGVTEYIDSVALLNDADRTLEGGLATVKLAVPLSQMNIPWANDSATYYRGAYVVKMLEAEIGKPNVLKALSLIAHERIGKDTRWADLRQYFERTGNEKLDWFWRQWVDGATFPHLTLKTGSAGVEIDQTGTAQPYRLRFAVRYKDGGNWVEKPVTMDSASVQVQVPSGTKPELKLFPYTLATAG